MNPSISIKPSLIELVSINPLTNKRKELLEEGLCVRLTFGE